MNPAEKVLAELEKTISLLRQEEMDKLADAILSARKIFIAGAGRSGLMGKAFAMRLVHMGFNAHVVGETTTPGITDEDIFILGSGSGETKTLLAMATKARDINAKIALVSIFPDSSLGKLADLTAQLPGASKEQGEGEYETIQPMGSLFEQTLLVFYDALILALMNKKGLDSHTMLGQHANLE
ncbi:6-phospho-3-hexuloisomerase [Priestia koreensis]|uniref:6-phospho-3-hexuloisomerase n=1 Tax=Priestia koreensis TaxID=284581 RepID=UPI00345AED81